MMRAGRFRRLRAGFTIEAAYIFPIILFSLAAVFGYAWNERNLTLSQFVLRESASRAAHLEPTYDPEGPSAEDISASMSSRFAGVDRLETGDSGASRSLLTGKAWFEGSSLSLTEERMINDPEDVLRVSTALEDFAQLNSLFKGGNTVASDSE